MKHTLLLFLALSIFSLTVCDSGRSVRRINSGSGLSVISLKTINKPLIIGKAGNTILDLTVNQPDSVIKRSLKKIIICFSDNLDMSGIDNVEVLCGSASLSHEQYKKLGGCSIKRNKVSISGDYHFSTGINRVEVSLSVRQNANLMGKLLPENIKIILDERSGLPVPEAEFPVYRFAVLVRAAGQDDCNTYRIPGLVRTDKGTLIAVYDNRYESGKDLQGNIDVGMSRSTDGGETWQPMKIIIDMDQWGGRPESENGVGDPCILVDNATGTIWVAGLWLNGFPGLRAWNVSAPGLNPEVTGQFIVVKSDDDGITWSLPLNLTSQLKDPAWQLLLQGPGNGISLSDGTIVFPAQFRDADGLPYSTIAYSTDHGITWNIGKGAKVNTTESQCVQLSDGSIMLNMRDNRNSTVRDASNGRAVVTTTDMGKKWVTHPSSNSALPEPVCMASLIAADIMLDGEKKKVLFFSNPDSRTSRTNMTIKTSVDEGMTWPEEYQVELNGEEGYGYSCLTLVDDNTIGILYEGVGDLYFQKIPLKDIFGKK